MHIDALSQNLIRSKSKLKDDNMYAPRRDNVDWLLTMQHSKCKKTTNFKKKLLRNDQKMKKNMQMCREIKGDLQWVEPNKICFMKSHQNSYDRMIYYRIEKTLNKLLKIQFWFTSKKSRITWFHQQCPKKQDDKKEMTRTFGKKHKKQKKMHRMYAQSIKINVRIRFSKAVVFIYKKL